jgi:hypothetical protein
VAVLCRVFGGGVRRQAAAVCMVSRVLCFVGAVAARIKWRRCFGGCGVFLCRRQRATAARGGQRWQAAARS